MAFTFRVQPIHTNGANEFLADEIPDTCPLCNVAIHPIYIHGIESAETRPAGGHVVELIFRCPRSGCERLFLAFYYGERVGVSPSQCYPPRLRSVAPQRVQKINFDQKIEKLSPKFAEIYNQANKAEKLELAEIAGPGYRKALEFLIKDFAIQQKPADESKIKKQALMQVINEIGDANVRDCATRATWLGNDETHYERLWSDHDIKDLKMLIEVAKNWILNVLIMAGYKTDMPAGKK